MIAPSTVYSNATLQLWAHLYDSERGTLAVWSTGGQAQGPHGPRTKYFDYPAQAKAAAEHARKESETGREAYFCSHLLTAQRRNKENAAPVRTLWNEYDGAEVPNGNLKPTALVESSPGRFHAYWRLTDAIPPETAEDLNERIAQATGADPSGFDLSQLLRVPDTVNHKYQDRPVVRLVGINDEHEYVPADLHNALPKKKKEKFAKAGPVGEQIPPGRRNKDLVSIAGTMRRRGMDEAEILAALQVANERRCSPPLEAEEVEGIAASVARYEPAREVVSISTNGRGAATIRHGHNLTDLGNSERFVADHGESVRYCYPWRRWLGWTGARWERDEAGQVHRLAKKTVRGIYREAAAAADDEARKALASHARRSESETKIRAMVELAKSELPAAPDELDADPWLLNVSNGTIDLRTGELRAHDPADLITRVAPVSYDSGAQCPRFKQFLKETLVDEAVISFMKRYAGYTLTGITRERLFAILHGFGKNGKSTLVEILQDVMGDYATNTDTETILAKKYQGVGNDVAALKGARFVSAAEVEKGRRLAESKVKQLTGSDTVTARFLFGEPFDFRPAFKLWLSTNNKPVIQGTDDAIWDRIRLVPFEQRFEGSKADLKLPEKLRAELPGVLAWMVEGCLEWQEHGLGEPDSVKAATDLYRSEMDTLAAFIEDRCVIRPDAVAQATPLYKEYRMWCDDAGERPETQKTFGMRLTERGFESARSSSGVNKGRKVWHGIGLRNDIKPPGGGDDGSPGERCAGDRSPDESGVGIGNTPVFCGGSERSEPTNQQVPLEIPRVYKNLEKGSLRSLRSPPTKKTTGGGPQTNSTNSQTHPPPDAPDTLSTLLESRPAWLTKQAAECVRRGASASLLKALAAAVADQALDTPSRADEVLPFVRDNLAELAR